MAKKKMVLTISVVALVTVAILAVALAVVFNANGVAMAGTITSGGDNTGTTTVTYSVDNTWTVEIPTDITIEGETGKGTGTETASGVKIEKETNLKVTVSSGNEWMLKDSEEHKLDYELKKGEEKLENGNEVLSVAAGSDGGSQELTAELTAESKKYATGEDPYTDTLTFTVTVA